MGNPHCLVLLACCLLLGCGGSARTTHDASGGSSPVGPIGGEGGSDSESPGGNGSGMHLGPGSWDVSGSITTSPSTMTFCYQSFDPNAPEDNAFDFSLTVRDGIMTVGIDGVLRSAPVQIIDGAYLAKDIELPNAFCSTADPLIARELRLRGVDSDGDGEADRLESTATLEPVLFRMGDSGLNVTPSVELSAVPDQSSPTLSFAGGPWPWSNWNPLDELRVLASEPLNQTTIVTLDGTIAVSLTDPLKNPAITFLTAQILPLGGTWQLVAQGQDLAGHPVQHSDELPVFKTQADPGVLPQDGFEGVPSALPSGASVVTGYGTVPPISGEHSLWLAGAGLIHLQRSGSEQHLHFAAREFFGASKTLSKNVRAGVVGSKETVTFIRTAPASQTIDMTGDDKFPTASGVAYYDALITAPGKDAILSIEDLPCTDDNPVYCHEFTASAWLIDDLKID